MSDNMLSIMIPAAPGSETRLRSLLSRITLAHRMTPHYNFEVIVCDGGSSDDSKSLCEFISQFIPLKYIYIPIYKHVNPSYLINAMVRVSEGQYLCYMSVDYYPSEYFLKVIDSLKNIEPAGIVFGQLYSNPQVDPINKKLPAQLLDQSKSGLKFVDVIRETKMKSVSGGPMWAATREFIVGLEGFYRNLSDDINAACNTFKNLQQVYCDDFKAIHIHHDNKEKANISPIVARQGKLTEYSFSIINGVSREPDAHELWINDNVHDVEAYPMQPVGEI